MPIPTAPAFAPVPTWTHEELSDLFWRHHNRFFVASIAAMGLALVAVAALVFGVYELAAVATLGSLVMSVTTVWHRARTSLLTKMRFRDDR